MFFLLIAWSVFGTTKGVLYGDNNLGSINQQFTDRTSFGKVLIGSFCANETKVHNFCFICPTHHAFLSLGSFFYVLSKSVNEYCPAYSLYAHKCYPFEFYLVTEWVTRGTLFSVSLQIKYNGEIIGPYNSIQEPYNGCIDGYEGENCEIEKLIKSQIKSHCSCQTNILGELVALLFFQ
jgi:hypothetical protein